MAPKSSLYTNLQILAPFYKRFIAGSPDSGSQLTLKSEQNCRNKTSKFVIVSKYTNRRARMSASVWKGNGLAGASGGEAGGLAGGLAGSIHTKTIKP